MKCPVCGYLIKSECYYMEYTLLEEHAACQCGYHYSYVTGCYEETFGPFEFIQMYSGETYKNTVIAMGLAVWIWRVWWILKTLF